MVELKKVTYPGFNPPRTKGQVAYVVIGSEVFFSGLTGLDKTTSTINGAEGVILAISGAEGLNWNDYRWHDIQTHLAYNRQEPGEFFIDRLHISVEPDGRPLVDGWDSVNPDSLPEGVFTLFKPLIG